MAVVRILLVDDFLAWHRIVGELLEAENDLQIAATAKDGLDAVQKAMQLQPDLILMDLRLPGMNGLEATRQIRVASPASKVLFLSENRTSDVVESALQVGGLGYVLKSDAHSDLIAGIRSVLQDEQFISHSLIDRRDGFGKQNRK